jgi:hypothetical protein
MEFVETPVFTRLVTALLADDDYRGLQRELADNPECGVLIKDGGGRCAIQSRGAANAAASG